MAFRKETVKLFKINILILIYKTDNYCVLPFGWGVDLKFPDCPRVGDYLGFVGDIDENEESGFNKKGSRHEYKVINIKHWMTEDNEYSHTNIYVQQADRKDGVFLP